MFINLTNHPSGRWSSEQTAAAEEYGEIVDIPFPNVPADADETDVLHIADEYAERITAMNPDAVLCQGEMTLTYLLVEKLTERGIPVLAACSERCADEENRGTGTLKTVEFRFRRFRRYGTI